jgi:protein involved in polysaccharide export with SLBB domain
MKRFCLCAALLLGLGFSAAAADAPAHAPLRKGDALLIRIEGVGGGIPEYREIVDSDGNVEMPFLGFLSAVDKRPAELEAEMAKAYATLATGAVVHVTFITHFEPPPARQTLVRSEDPRRPVPAPGAPGPLNPGP